MRVVIVILLSNWSISPTDKDCFLQLFVFSPTVPGMMECVCAYLINTTTCLCNNCAISNKNSTCLFLPCFWPDSEN